MSLLLWAGFDDSFWEISYINQKLPTTKEASQHIMSEVYTLCFLGLAVFTAICELVCSRGSWKHSHVYFQLITADDCLYATIAYLRAPGSIEHPLIENTCCLWLTKAIWGHVLWKLQIGRQQHCWNKSQAQTAVGSSWLQSHVTHGT